jgi:GNAT superfamily N-acetyltransferase
MHTQIAIDRIESDADILATSEVMRQLRPHIKAEDYLGIVRRMMSSDGYKQAAVRQGGMVRAVAGYRFMEMLYCGKILYVDDLVTDEKTRSHGHGKQLIEWLENEARANGCAELHLDSGVQRGHAHRFYFREGLTINAYHFRRRV